MQKDAVETERMNKKWWLVLWWHPSDIAGKSCETCGKPFEPTSRPRAMLYTEEKAAMSKAQYHNGALIRLTGEVEEIRDFWWRDSDGRAMMVKVEVAETDPPSGLSGIAAAAAAMSRANFGGNRDG